MTEKENKPSSERATDLDAPMDRRTAIEKLTQSALAGPVVAILLSASEARAQTGTFSPGDRPNRPGP